MSASNFVGRTVDRYDVREQLGQGGFGAVYRARHRVVGNEVALKVLWPDHAEDPVKVERFMQEARAAAAVGSEHIVRVFDAGTTPEGVAFLALELLEGHDLEAELRRRRTLPVEEAVAVVCEILAGLAAAHARGIVHRDLKPGNVFLAKAERGRRVKILDFGISKMRGARTLTADGMVLGTPQYMAPEQLEGSRALDHRADLYAAGTILYEALVGRVPFEGSGYGVILKRVQGMRPPDLKSLAPGVPSAVCDVAMRALAVDPDARFETADAMQGALRDALSGRRLAIGSAPTMPAVPKEPISTPSRPALAAAVTERVAGPKPSALIGLAGLAVLLACGVGVLAVLGYRVATRPDARPEEEPVVATNAIPVPVEPDLRPTPPQPVPVPAPASPTPAPPPSPAAVRHEILSFTGTGQRAEVAAVVVDALPDAVRCATDRPLHLVVTVIISGGRVSVAHHDPSQRSDDTHVADCVGDAIVRAGVVGLDHTPTAVATVAVDLPPR